LRIPEVAECESVRHQKPNTEKLNRSDRMISSIRENEGSEFAIRIDHNGAVQEEDSIKYGKTKHEKSRGDETVR
jgi:L-alanine-DL-glutamate epimerase-like enolase superfamily enzyme